MTMVSVISEFDVVFSNPAGSYFEGDMVHGQVVVDLREDIVIENLQIIFRGTAVVHWPEDGGGVSTVLNSQSRSRRRRRSRLSAEETDEEQYLNQMICLYTRESNPRTGILVSAGKHSYPFTIQLPDALPSSFRGDYGYLTYTATAVLERPFLSQIVISKDFSVSSVVDLSTLDEDIMRPVHAVDRESLGICCFETGNVQCDWRLERRGFIPGDEIVINGEIHNNCNLRITKSKASLVQHTRYQGLSGNAIYQRKQMTKLEKSEVPPGTIGFWRERMTVPPNLPQTGLKGCNIISISYTLKLKVFLAMHRPIETVIEIIVGTNAIRSPMLQSLIRLSASTDSSRNESVVDPDTTYFI